MAFEGKTGPYLLYASVRMRSVFAKAGTTIEEAAKGTIQLTEPAEIDLAAVMLGYADAHKAAYERRMPHLLCEHAYAVAQAFSKFYAACPIANEDNITVRSSRLALSAATFRQLADILAQLGIAVPDHM